MKRIIVFLAVFLIVAAMASAVENVLIDFNELVDDFQGEHQATLMDFSSTAGTTFTEEEKAAMNTSLYVPNWAVELSSSSRSIVNDRLSYVRFPTVNAQGFKYAGENVLGVRVHFPTSPHNSYAWIKPPFMIPAFATNAFIEDAPKGDQFNGFGVIKNVGTIKSIKVNTYGMNFPVGLAVVLSDENEQTRQIPMGYLDFDGWRELTWENPNYIYEIRNRELRSIPLYPSRGAAVTLDSIQLYRDAMKEGGDFIGYFKDIVVTYDQAIIQDIDTDLNHEQIWGILAEREVERQNAELKRLGNLHILRYLEEKKMHQEEEEIQ